MAATLYFYGGVAQTYEFGVANSGLGFYGSNGFGSSVQVSSYQGRTFVTDSTGTVQGPECNNTQYSNSGTVILGQTGSGIPLTTVPNGQCPLRISFANDTAVKCQNPQLIIYDRTGSPPAQFTASGVTTVVAEVRHPSIIQAPGGSGNSTWTTFLAGVTGTILVPFASPGSGGLAPSGTNTTSVIHDWFFMISASPNSIGNKTQFGLYMYVEYL